MTAVIRTLAGATIVAGLSISAATGQAPPPVPDGPRYVVTYLEVMPRAAAEGAALARAMRDAIRAEAGHLRGEAVQRIGQTNQFVILAAWKDQQALDAHAKSAKSAELLEKFKRIQDAPYDERVTFPLSVGPPAATLGTGAVVVVSHVDVIPTQREAATALVKQHAEDGRKEAGNVRFEALTQTNRQNHFTVIEAWKNRDATQTHDMNATTRAFRDNIAPAIGALYDERFYTVLK
ncbi:MAG TPA: antibiotic biosynthesis monooxygenase [Xanthobacteraceae bacterium]